jgi:hypothetical protein
LSAPRAGRSGAIRAALTGLCLLPQPALAGPVTLRVVDAGGAEIMAAEMDRETRWCLVWTHSVKGFEVEDCFRQDRGVLMLERSHQPDFAAGLGDIPGRGTVVSDGAGGYWIEGIDAVLPGDVLPIRIGTPLVNHRLRIGTREWNLSERAAGARAVVRLEFSDD